MDTSLVPLTRCLCLSTMGPPNLQFNRVFRLPRPSFFMVLGDGLDFFWGFVWIAVTVTHHFSTSEG